MENTDQILDAPQVENMRLQYAGFWIRTGAYLIDTIIIYAVNFVIGYGLSDLLYEVPALITVIGLGVGICYFAFMESSQYQATLGKMAVGIKVGDQDGDQIGIANAIGRYFGKMISGLLLGIGFMMVGWDEKCQGIHDNLANTYVFYSR